MNNKKAGVLLIGNFLSRELKTRALCEEFATRLLEKGFNVYTTSRKRNRIIKLFDILFNAYKLKNKYFIAIIDLFSSKAFYWGFLSGIFLNLLKKDFIVVLRGGELPEFSRDNEGFVRYLLQRAKKVIAPSEYLKKGMESFRKDIVVIPNPIDISKYEFYLRRKIKKKIIWLRAFHYVYNPMMAVLVLEEIFKKDKEFVLCMIGPDKKDGSLKEIRKFVAERNIKENLEIIEGIPKEKVPAYLNDYDIFLNTSNIDNFPVSVLEAMACGLCIVTTEVGGIPYLLENYHDSLFVPRNDFKEMAEKIFQLLYDENLCERISINARRKAENYGWDKVLPRWIEIING